MIQIQKKIIVSRDVIFNEDACWNWESKVTSPSVFLPEVDVNFELGSPLISSSTEDDTTDSPLRRVRSIDEIYATCEFACFSIKLLVLKMQKKKRRMGCSYERRGCSH